MTPREAGILLALDRGPLTPEQAESAARILASVDLEDAA